MVFSKVKPKVKTFPVAFGRCRCGYFLFWDCPCPPLAHIRDCPEFHKIVNMDKGNWPRSLLWHCWPPAVIVGIVWKLRLTAALVQFVTHLPWLSGLEVFVTWLV